MMKAGISQRTWKCTPLSLISAHWSTTVRTRKPKTRIAMPSWIARRTRLLRGGLVPNFAPASPRRCRRGWLRSTASHLSDDAGRWENGGMGEFELLARIRERLPADKPRIRLGSGDDAAVTVPGAATATSVDALVEGVHFSRDSASLAQIGHKALAAALSDLAAMGAEAGEAYVVLGVPPELSEGEFLSILDGMLRLAGETGTTLAGGDLTRAPALSLALTVVGHAERPEHLVQRGGAAPGEVLVVTGELGGAAGGLLLLERPELAEAISPEQAER